MTKQFDRIQCNTQVSVFADAYYYNLTPMPRHKVDEIKDVLEWTMFKYQSSVKFIIFDTE